MKYPCLIRKGLYVAEMKTVIKNGGLGIRQYTEKPRGTLCARIVYGVGSLQHIAPWLAPCPKGGKND